MLRNSTLDWIATAHGRAFRSLGKWTNRASVSQLGGLRIISRRYATDSSTPASGVQDQATPQTPLRLRKVYTCPVTDRRDVYVNSLDATLKAHRHRGQQRTNVAGKPSAKPPLVRMIGRVHSDPSPQAGERHWASFEDFQAQHQPGDLEWERRLGSDIETSGYSSVSGTIRSTSVPETGSQGSATSDIEHEAPPPIPSPVRKLRLRQRRDQSVGVEQPVGASYGSEHSWPKSIAHVQNDYIEQSSDEALSSLILAFEDFQRVSRLDRMAMTKLLDQVSAIIGSVLPGDEKPQLHGSSATGLANLHSDVDINIPLLEDPKDWLDRGPSPGRQQIRRRRLQILKRLQKAFHAQMTSIHTELSPMKYPLLKIQDLKTKVIYQITCGRWTAATTETVCALLDEYPSVRPLHALLRTTLLIRDLNDASKGGVGSYCLFVMILTALKHSGSLQRGDSLAQQLLAVFEFWERADIHQTGYAAVPMFSFHKHNDFDIQDSDFGLDHAALLSITSGIAHIQAENRAIRKRYQKSRQYSRNPFQLSLQDPANPSNDLGYPSYRMLDVLETLRRVGWRLREAMKKWDAAPLERRDDPMLNLLYPMINIKRKEWAHKRRALQSVLQSADPSLLDSEGAKVAEDSDDPVKSIDLWRPFVRKSYFG